MGQHLRRRKERQGADRAAEQAQHGELLGGEQLAADLLRAELAADALGRGVREAGRRGRRRTLRLAARAWRQVQQHVEQVAQRERAVRGRLEKRQAGLRPFELGGDLRQRQGGQREQEELEQRVLLRHLPRRHAHQQFGQQRRALGGRHAREGHLDVHERKVGDHRVVRREEELGEAAKRQQDRRVALDALVDVAEDGHHLVADRRLGGREEAEDVGQRDLEQLSQLGVLAKADAQLRRLELLQEWVT